MSEAERHVVFTELYHEYRPRVRRLCAGYLSGTGGSVDDLEQEIYLNVWRGIERFRGEAAPGSWLYRIAVNTCLRYLRSRKRRLKHESRLGPPSPVQPDYGPPHERLLLAIGELGEVDRLLVTLTLEELSGREIADITGMTPGAVRTRLHRARNALKTKLTNHG
jgi:RNA polymerase sigma-70 factor (ECF subfamily)